MKNDRLQETNNKNNLKLAPETMRIRDVIIEKYSDTPLDKLSAKLQSLITNDTDTATRLGIFSARVEILRMRFAGITEKKYIKENKLETDPVSADEDEDENKNKNGDLQDGWMTLKILEASEVNGVRFPEGVKIDVHSDDAKKLLDSKKAELISLKIEDTVTETLGDNQTILEDADSVTKKGGDQAEEVSASLDGTKTEGTKSVDGDQVEVLEEGTAFNPEEIAAIKGKKA